MLCQVDYDDDPDGIIRLLGGIFKRALIDAQAGEPDAVEFLARECPDWVDRYHIMAPGFTVGRRYFKMKRR